MLGRGGPSSARRRAEHQGEGGLSAEHVVNFGHLVHDLIHGGKGEGHHARIQINFDDVGSKWLVMEYANLIV